MEKKITVIRGDGIGPEIIDAAVLVLDTVTQKFGHTFECRFVPLGGEAIDAEGVPLPVQTLEACKSSDAVLLGAVGGPRWDNLAAHLRPERALLSLRSSLGLFANIRPVVLTKELAAASPLKPEIAKKGVDIVIVRELTGGIPYGPRGYKDGPFGQEAYDTEIYSIFEIERIAKVAFDLAAQRRKRLTSIDKANILESGKLWRATVSKIARSFPEVACGHMLADSAAAELIKNPSAFDIVLCPNFIGDIFSSAAAALKGSVGLLPSASLGAAKFGVYGPAHGSAPDIAGTDAANPIGAILSVSMMLSHSFDLPDEAAAIETAVTEVLNKGFHTADFSEEKSKKVTCSRMAELIAMQI